jgi:lipopolysaccharide export system protein LptC
MTNVRDIVLVGLLAAGAVASWYLGRPQVEEQASTPGLSDSHRGYYLKSARILGTGPEGKLLYELLAREAEQLDESSVSFTDVRINYSPKTDVPWSVDADTATVYANEKRVLLEGHVRATSSEGFSGSDTEIRTEYLEIYPDDFRAETDERVQIRIGSRSLTATGMLASLKDNQVKLKSNVHGIFAP